MEIPFVDRKIDLLIDASFKALFAFLVVAPLEETADLRRRQ